MNSYDLLVIGTSPLVLLRARAVLPLGGKAIIIDSRQYPGGSWFTPPMLGFDAVEPAVHLLENRPALYAALAAAGVQLEPDCNGFGLVRGRRISLAQSRVVLHGLVALKSALEGSMDRARRIGRSALRAVTDARTPFLYPPGGCRTIVGTLLAALPQAQLRLGCVVDEIAFDQEGPARVSTSVGEVLAERVLIASRAHAPLRLSGALLPIEIERNRVHSLVLWLTEADFARFGYVEVVGDKRLRRARDVSTFTRPVMVPGERMICVQTRAKETGETALADLIRLGLVPADVALRDWVAHDIDLATITDRCLRDMATRAGPRLEVMPTTDFADGYVSAVRNG